jgi:hypothetical protein
MKTKVSGLMALALALCAVVVPVSAQQLSQSEAAERVKSIEANHQWLLERFPRLTAIDAEIQGDCGRKVPDRARKPGYCRCASAVTMSAWRAGDPNMIARLKDFIEKPNDVAAADFLSYQGPELYQPLCDLAL